MQQNFARLDKKFKEKIEEIEKISNPLTRKVNRKQGFIEKFHFPQVTQFLQQFFRFEGGGGRFRLPPWLRH